MSAPTRRYAFARTAWCRVCGARAGFYCTTTSGATASRPHQARLDEAHSVARAEEKEETNGKQRPHA